MARRIPGGYANGQAIAYIYSRDSEAEARQAKVLTADEARRIVINIARGTQRAKVAHKISHDGAETGSIEWHPSFEVHRAALFDNEATAATGRGTS
jgi:hypothetical protein